MECLQICRCTEVREQQKAAIEILGEHRGRVDASIREKRSDTDERRTALAGRRRIHHDQGQRVAAWRIRRCERHPKIAAKARVLRRWSERIVARTQHGSEPIGKRVGARVGRLRIVGQIGSVRHRRSRCR